MSEEASGPDVEASTQTSHRFVSEAWFPMRPGQEKSVAVKGDSARESFLGNVSQT